MKLPLQVVFRGFDPSPAIESVARDKAHKLEQFCGDLMSCRVDIEQLDKHKHQGRPFAVRIHVTMPGHELNVDRVQHEDVHIALRDAFDDMKRRLEDTVRRLRGDEKQHAAPLHGEVVRLVDDGAYGFIRGADGTEYYFARDNLVDVPFEHIQVGTRVQFIAEPAAEGVQAKRVSLGKHGFS
jgi:ribosome-associated translation inhibitor RaiA/cold shock CspA family protein